MVYYWGIFSGQIVRKAADVGDGGTVQYGVWVDPEENTCCWRKMI